MKKKKNSFFRFLFIAAAFTGAVLLIYVFFNEGVKNRKKEKAIAEDILRKKINQLELTKIRLQKVSSRERISKIASDSLGLMTPVEDIKRIYINKFQLEQIKREINSRYD